VLAELTAAAEDAPKDTDTEKKAAGRLGDYLHGMKDALARRSTRELRDGARQRLLETDAQITERAHRSPPSEDRHDPRPQLPSARARELRVDSFPTFS
jgi:hypothetical protein